jgi:hypothetical protein
MEAAHTEATHIGARVAHMPAACIAEPAAHMAAAHIELPVAQHIGALAAYIEAARTSMRHIEAHIAMASIAPAAATGALRLQRAGAAMVAAAKGRPTSDRKVRAWRKDCHWDCYWDFHRSETYRHCNPRRRPPRRIGRPRKRRSAISAWQYIDAYQYPHSTSLRVVRHCRSKHLFKFSRIG